MLRNKSLINAVAGLLALVAFVFMLLCTISTPIVKGIYLFRITSATNTNHPPEVAFGVFGGCGTTSNFRRNTNQQSTGSLLMCTPTELSYEILSSEQYQNPSGSYSFRSVVIVDHNTTSALIMNPIAAGLAALAMMLAPIAALLRGRVMHGITAIILFMGALLTWATFGLNLAVGLMVHDGPDRSVMGIWPSASFKFEWGAVMPLSLVAAVLLSVATILCALSFFLIGRRDDGGYRYGHNNDKSGGRGSVSSY